MEKNIPGILHGNNLHNGSDQPNSNKHTIEPLSVSLERIYLRLLYAEYEINDSLTILCTGSGNNTLFSNILLCMRWDQYRHQAIADPVFTSLQNDSADVILNTLSANFFDEFHRVLKPGSLMLMTILLSSHTRELEDLICESGFIIERTIEISGTHITLCCRKRW